MATELETYAAHCRMMAKAAHHPACTGFTQGPQQELPSTDPLTGEPEDFLANPPRCDGSCITMRDRALWLLLATEAETYLRAHEPEPLPL